MSDVLTNKRKTYIEIYLPFFLLLAQYKIGILSLGEIGILVLVAIRVFKDHFKFYISINKSLMWLFIYVSVRTLINGVLHTNEFSAALNTVIECAVMMVATVYLADTEFDEEKLYKTWKVAGLLFAAGLVYHIVCLYLLGRGIKPISILPGYILRSEEGIARPSSVFAEPASFVCAMLPLVFLSLKHDDYVWAFGSSLMVIASTSSTGIFLTLILWVVAYMQKGKSFQKRFLLVLIVFFGIWLIENGSIFVPSLQKLNSILRGGSTVGSRIVNGFQTIATMNPIEWIFGTTYNDSSLYIIQHIDKFPDNSPVRVYMAAHGHIFMNSFCQIIFQYGLVGLLIYWRSIYSRLKIKNYEAKSYLIMILVSIFGQSKFLNAIFFMELMFLLLYDRKETEV